MVLALLVVVLGYVAYVFIDYHRIGDQELTAEGTPLPPWRRGRSTASSPIISASAHTKMISASSWTAAPSPVRGLEERLTANIERIGAFLQQQDADLYLLQEVDRDPPAVTVDEAAMLTAQLPGLGHIWRRTMTPPYLFLPVDQPHGKSVSGLLTPPSFGITEARRVSAHRGRGLMKLVDLDRYSVHRIPAADGRELVLYVHLSAYTSDGPSLWEQLELLRADMQAGSMKRATAIAGGDFNKDLGQSEEIFGALPRDTWAQPPAGGIWDGTDLSLVAPLTRRNFCPEAAATPTPVSRGQYANDGGRLRGVGQRHREQAVVEDTGFAWSDHNRCPCVAELREREGVCALPSVEEGISAGTKISRKIIAIRC